MHKGVWVLCCNWFEYRWLNVQLISQELTATATESFDCSGAGALEFPEFATMFCEGIPTLCTE